MTNSHSFVEILRLVELQNAVRDIPAGSRVLEIGAGTGWQARELNRRGFEVEAVDIPDGHYTQERIWPVRDYDGRRLPFGDESFDLIFSSNVLEHVGALPEHLVEQRRVLKAGGEMIHVVPSASWRFWTSLTYYPNALRRRVGEASPMQGTDNNQRAAVPSSRSAVEKLWAPVHGTAKSPFREFIQFRKRNWLQVFAQAGFQDIGYRPTGLFYSGHLIFGPALSIATRTLLAKPFGSSCHVFLMRKPGRLPAR
jgi:ubiquinone/menaquinone biosynthesis C-methylase UbiE